MRCGGERGQMKVLVTGAHGFVGKNLCESLKSIRDGKDRRERFSSLLPLQVFECTRKTPLSQLDEWCGQADFVFHLAGANRPPDPQGFTEDNVDFTARLMDALEKHGNACPVMYASSVQATLLGRYAGSAYGESKREGERLVREHAHRVGGRALIYRLPNLYGKWCRPNCHSVVATFCHNVAHGLPLTMNDPATRLVLLYVDDLVDALLAALCGREQHAAGASADEDFCVAGPTDEVDLGQIANLLRRFEAARTFLEVPNVSAGSFSKKLYSTYLSYLDANDLSYQLDAHKDARGSFTEFLRTPDRGQVSVNVSKPGITKGQHWHHTKGEKFLVVSGEALIRLRRVGKDANGRPFPVAEYRVSGSAPEVVEMIPGYTHSITNLSDTEDLVTVMWANEPFDPANPDTYYEEV